MRYPGGKSKLIDFIYSHLNLENTDVFVEPFAGGASVGLSLLEAGIIKNLVINDMDIGIYSLFTIIKEDPATLINLILKENPTHEDYFKAQKNIKANYENCNMLEAAWSLLLVNRLAYSGIYKTNPLGGKNGSQKDLLARWTKGQLINRIIKIHKLAEKITISNIDGCKVIEEMYWHPGTTILIDPPYYEQGHNLYLCYFDDYKHIELNVLLESLFRGVPGADMILYYDNAEFIRKLYIYPEILRLNRMYSI